MRLAEALDIVAAKVPDDFVGRSVEFARLAADYSDPTLLNWRHDYEEAISKAYTWGLWGAAYVIGDGCSDDGFLDFRTALPSFGMRRLKLVISDPDSLAELGAKLVWLEREGFHYPFNDLLQERGLDELTLTTSSQNPTGIRWKEGDLSRLYPKLWELCSQDEDVDTLIPPPGSDTDDCETFLGFVSCYLVLTDSFTKVKQNQYAEAIDATKTRKLGPSEFWKKTLNTGITKEWITSKRKAQIFGFVCDGFSWCSSYNVFMEVFSLTLDDFHSVKSTWANFEAFSKALTAVINKG